MHTYSVKRLEEEGSLSPQSWDAFVAESPWGHVLQTYRWGRFKAEFGWHPIRLVAMKDSVLVGVAQMLLRPLPLGRAIAYLPRGPVINPQDRTTRRLLLAGADAVARQHRSVFLKVEPCWGEDKDDSALWQELDMRPSDSVQPRSTIMLDLLGTDEEWLARMKQKTRYNIRLAKRRGVEIREGNRDDLPIFHDLMVTTGQRDGFAVRSVSYYQKAWELFAPEGMATLLLASFEGQVLAGLMPFACGNTAWYMYGASSNYQRNRMPNYALQWAAMLWARARGCSRYDLWGIPDESELSTASGSSLGGVYRFKKGFGGYLFRAAGSYDAVFSPLLYWAYQRMQRWRRR
ncbi:MAG: lipid II:glycine glycyltransferase FemX [Anaerolineae bacterium]